MHSLVNDYAAGLLEAQESPCLSLYQPTHRHHPDNLQDPIRYRNLVKAMEQSLRQKYAIREVRPLLEPGDLTHPEVDDLLDDLGELVLKKGGQVVIVPAERMPARTGIAAIYRF